MNRTNYLLLIGVVVLLVVAVAGGQLEFRRTHPGGTAGLAPVPGPAGDGASEPAGQPAAALNVTDFDQGPGPNDGKPFPAEVAGLLQTARFTGAAALAEISKLHGKDIPAAGAEVATYGSGEEKVVVWTTVSPTKEEAQALFRRMLERMEAGQAAYTKPELLNIKNRAYFSTRGNGLQHYFYLRGARLYWVALKVPMDKVMGVMSFIVNQL